MMCLRKMICCFLLIIGVVLFCSCQKEYNRTNTSVVNSKPYLELSGVEYIDSEDKSKGVKNFYFLYSIEEEKMIMKEEILSAKGYPVSCFDPNTNRIYYSANAGDDDYENLFTYDVTDKLNIQRTREKMLYNDIFLVENKLFANVATTGKTVTQPAIINTNDFKFDYLDEDNDDTWIFSFSYSHKTKDLLILTCSDSEMRTDKVTRVTHIRPKKIYSMDLNFSNKKLLYETDKYEIRETRRLNENKIIMVYTDSMMHYDRKIKIIDLVSKEEVDLSLDKKVRPGSIYPDKSGENLYIFGEKEGEFAIFVYSLQSDEIIRTITKKELFGDENISLVNFKYSILNIQ